MANPTLWNANGYNSLLYMKLQEKGKLISTVSQNLDGFGGAEFTFADQQGPREATEITSRLGNTQWQEPDAYRRRIGKRSFEFTTLLDKFEKLDRLSDPTSGEFKNATMALGRVSDKLIIDNMRGDAYLGENSTATALPSAQKIAHGSAGITIAKLVEVNEKFNEANVDPDEKKYMVIGPKQLSDMLVIEQLTSADYAAVKALVQGKVDNFMGFTFIVSNQLVVASNIRYCLAYVESAFELVIDQAMVTTSDRLPERRNAIGVQTQYSLGGTRTEEEKAVEVACDES